MNYSFTLKSANQKTGPMPVTTSPKQTCPDTCPHYDTSCYAKWGPLGIHWTKLSTGERGITYDEMLQKISDLPDQTIWRHNQAGDLNSARHLHIGSLALQHLVEANKGKRGFTYTHYPMTLFNQGLVQYANLNGFTINLSADSYEQALEYLELDIAPVTMIVEHDEPRKSWHMNGTSFLVCPATYMTDTSCLDCKICAIPERKSVVCFPAHGTKKKEFKL